MLLPVVKFPRWLLLLLVWLLALGWPQPLRASIPPYGSLPPVLPVLRTTPLLEDAADALTLHLDGLHDRAGPCRRVLVRQNPWSKFDPEGLNEVYAGNGRTIDVPDGQPFSINIDSAGYRVSGKNFSTDSNARPASTFEKVVVLGVAAAPAAPAAVAVALATPAVATAATTAVLFHPVAATAVVESAIVGGLVYNDTGDPVAAIGSAGFNGLNAYANGGGGKSPSGSAKETKIQQNAQQGKAFEGTVGTGLRKTDSVVADQVTVQTPSGVSTRVDFASKTPDGTIKLTEAKSSTTAPLTKNQKAAFPEIATSGGTVTGKGTPGFEGGTKIPPTKVDVVRPKQRQ